MNDHDSLPADVLERIHGFVVASEGNEVTEAELADFEQFLKANDDACRLYVEYLNVSMLASYALNTMPEDGSSSTDLSMSSAPVVPSPILQGTAGFFTSGWPVAYLIATVVLGDWACHRLGSSCAAANASRSLLARKRERGRG